MYFAVPFLFLLQEHNINHSHLLCPVVYLHGQEFRLHNFLQTSYRTRGQVLLLLIHIITERQRKVKLAKNEISGLKTRHLIALWSVFCFWLNNFPWKTTASSCGICLTLELLQFNRWTSVFRRRCYSYYLSTWEFSGEEGTSGS